MSDDPLLTALIGLRDRLDAVADEFHEEIGKLRAEMSARFDRIEDRMTRMRDEVDLSMGRVDELGSAMESSSATHRQLWRLYRRLQTDVDELKNMKGGK